MSFARNFAMGQQIARNAMDTYEKAKLRSELAEAYKANPEQSTGFTAEQGEQLRLAGESGENDIGYDEARKAYTITPKAGGEATFIPMQPVTDFLGKRTAGSMSDQQVNTARLRSVADIMGTRDPLTGLQLRDQIARGERDDQRFAWEKSRSEREERTAAQKESDDQLMRGIDAEVGESVKQRLTQPDGTSRDMTVDDYLYGSQMRAARLLAAGKSSEAGQAIKDYQAQSLAKIQLETAQRNEALGQTVAALNAGDFSKVVDFYNTYVPDGNRVTDVVLDSKTGAVTIKRETIDGRPAPDTVIKDTGLLTAALATSKDPMAVYNWSQNEFQNSLRQNQDQRAENADRRAGAAAAQSNADRQNARADREAKANAAVALFKERNPGASEAELNAVRNGVLAAVQEGGIKSDYKPDQFGAGGTVVQTDKSGNITVTKVDASGKPTAPLRITAPGSAAAPTQKPKTEADAHAQAASAIKKGAPADAVNAELAAMGFKPLPSASADSANAGARPAAMKQAAVDGGPGARSGAASPAASMPPIRQALGAPTESLGKTLDAAKKRASDAQDAVQKYGLKQQKQDPQGFDRAKQELAAARSAYRVAQQAFESAASEELGPVGYGALRR